MDYENYLGKSETVQDVVGESFLQDAAAVLDMGLPTDGCMPVLWHWMMFTKWTRSSELRADGGVLGEGFLPPFHHLPRRMAAGGRFVFRRPLRVGESVVRTSRIHSIRDKVGRSGPLVLLTIQRIFTVADEVVLEEEQDVVYMQGDTGHTQKASPAASSAKAPLQARSRSYQGDPLALFRYSALTANSHRIHYDLDYATRVEGFPGLVVHGPLQATWLAALASSVDPSKRVVSMQFRNLGPAYHTDVLEALAWEEEDVLRLDLRKRSGELCMSGSAVLG